MTARLHWNNQFKELGNQPVLIGKPAANQSGKPVANKPPKGNTILLNDPKVSPGHATIKFDANIQRYTITDLNGVGSPFNTYIQRSNPDGTYENKLKLLRNKPYPLSPSDIILVGQTKIVYEVVPGQSAKNPGGGCGGFIVFLMLIALIGAGIYASQNQNSSTSTPTSTPEKTLTDFCSAVKSGDYQTAYNQLSTHSKNQGTEAQFASMLRQTISKQGSLKNCTVSGVKPHQTTATGTLTYTFANGKTMSYLDSLVTENTVWKIDSAKTA
ncbi:MAG: FHA domain-containing protein [Ktedonobacteraceae bacterium]